MKHKLFSKAFASLVALLGLGAGAWAAITQVNDETAASTTKFHVDVTGYAPASADGTRTPVAVNADVYGDYHFVVSMPDAANSTVGADKATVNVRMTGVKTLGMKDGETRSYSKTVETGVSGVNATLATSLSNVYAFKGATIPVTIKDGAATVQFDYQIGAFSNHQIVGTPSDEAKAREAWHLITGNVSASQDLKDNDTHFLFKRGAYILIGDEKLVFDQDYDFLKGNADLGTLFSDVRPYVHVEKSGLSGQAANKAVIYMPEGSTLGISSSAAVLNKDAFLTVDATDKPTLELTGMLSGLRDQLAKSGDASTKVAIAFAVGTVNEIVGLVDEAGNVPVTLEFKKNKFHVDVTGYSSYDANAVPVTVNADVYSDYSFDVSLPAVGSDQLTASKATVNLRMSDVASLGVSGTRSYSKTVETGVGGVTATLSGALENTYAFQGASCPVTIKADGQEKHFTYNIAGIKDNHIVGTPSSSADAQAAWKLMTSKVTAAQGATDDTHFLFKKGAYLQIGDERLVFLKDFDFLKGTASMASLFDGAQTRIEKANVTGGKTIKGAIYLPAGSTLGVSQSNASVTEDVKITMSAFDEVAAGLGEITGSFTSIEKDESKSPDAKTAIAFLVHFFDGLVGMVDATDGVNFTVEFTPAKGTPKFHLDVTGYDYDDPSKEIAVNADVYSDYSFNVSLPDPLNDNLTASKATVNIAMTGVQSLGLKEGETRSYTKTVETGVTGVSAKLSNYLKNTYAFQGVKCPVTIKDETGSKSFDYQIAGINEDYQIVGTPSSTADARAAWKLMTSHVKASQNLSTNDTHFLFKKGAYLQLGDEKLVFDADYDFLKGSANLGELFSGIRPYVRVLKSGLTGDAVKSASVYLPAGSTLGVSSSSASVDEDVKVTMDVSKSAVEASQFSGKLSDLRDQINKSDDGTTKVAIALLVKYFDEVVGVVDGADEVPFTVEFTKPETPKFHLDVTGYSSDADDAELVPVNADVYGDYHFVVALPAPDLANLVASKATVNVTMTGVQSLGLKPGESRSYSKTLETGVTGVHAKLPESLKNTYQFNGVECPVTIEDATGTRSFTYTIAGINEDYQIVGTPSSTEDARAAWKFMTSHVKASQDLSTNDTHFLFKKGAYVQLGDEKLVFDTDFDFMKGSASLDDLFNDIRPAVHVEKADLTGDALKTASVFLPMGSTLGVSSSSATIDQNVTVTMDASQSQADESLFKGLLSGYRDKVYSNGSANKQTAIALLVYYFDQVVGLVDNAEKVPFTVEFTEPVIKVDGEKADKALSFSDGTEKDKQQTFTVTGEHLGADVAVAVTEGADHFSVDVETVPVATAENGVGQVITVTFDPASAAGTVTGKIALTSEGAETRYVSLSGKVTADYYDVVIGSRGVTTLYLDEPLVIPFDGDSGLMDGGYQTYDGLLSVSYVKSTTDAQATMKALRQYIPAYTGVVILGNPGTYRFPKYKGEEAALPDVSDNMLKGCLVATPTSEAEAQYGKVYTLQPDPRNIFMFKHFTGAALAANKVFLPYNSEAAKALQIVFDDNTTGISSLDFNHNVDGAWYTLSGAKMDKHPTVPGVYIHNGKKIVIKK